MLDSGPTGITPGAFIAIGWEPGQRARVGLGIPPPIAPRTDACFGQQNAHHRPRPGRMGVVIQKRDICAKFGAKDRTTPK
jgi:hypothetical protein